MRKDGKKADWQLRGMAVVASVVIGLSILVVLLPGSSKADDFTFDSETVNKGSSTNPSYRDSEDGQFNVLTEGDQYADTNFSGSSENVITGTAGGGAFPGSLDSDDATRRSYTEASGGGGSPTIQVLRPTSDGDVTTMVEYPTSPTTHFDKADETDVGGDGDTTYLEGVSNNQESELGMSDATDPGGSYDIDVTMWHISRGETTSACTVVWGIEIGGVEYEGGSTTMTSITYANFSYEWTTDPSDASEWTLAEVNGLECYIRVTDANPDTRTTQIGLVVTFTPTGTYSLDAQITFSSVTSTGQTTSYMVYCQGYRSASENFLVNAWDYNSLSWNLKATINSGSDTDFNFDLTANERDSGSNEVKLQIVDADSDGVQDTVYFDVLKIRRIEIGYALDIDMTCTTSPTYGNITLRIKGYTSAEQFNVNVWNYSSSSYDTGKLSITSLSNTWQTTIDLVDASHRSGSSVKIQFTDETSYTSDTTADSLYLDVVWVTRYYTDPTITAYGASPPVVTEAEAIVFFLTYTDYDNQAPSAGYPKVHIDTSDFTMTENNSGDTTYVDGKLYYFSKADLSGGTHDYYFIVDDAQSGEVTTAPAQVTVNRKPTLSGDTVLPATGNSGQTFSFKVTFTDQDGDLPSYIKAVIDASEYDMVEDDAEDTNTVDGKGYHYDKALGGGNHPYYFKTSDVYSGNVQTTEKNVYVNNLPALSGYGRTPADPVYVTTDLNFTVTFTDSDNDLPTIVKWRENGGSVQNITMVAVDPDDLTTTDGKQYCLFDFNLGHGSHDYDFWAADSGGGVSGGSNSITIQNRAPVITNKFVDDHEWRNTYWEYDYSYSEDDGDSVGFEMSTNATFLNINSGSGLVYGTTSDPVGWYSVTVWCNDSYGGSDSDEFILYVDNRVPVISNGPGATPSEWRNTYWEYDFDATDADTDTLNWERSGPSFLSINPSSGLIYGTTPDAPGNYGYTVWCNDSYGGSDYYDFTLSISNRVPVIGSSGNTTQTETTYLAYHILATDGDSDSLTYELSTNASWASISGEWVNGTATGVGWYDFTIWVNDTYDSDYESWQLTVEEFISNLPPYFTSEPILNWPNNTGYLYDVDAVDPEEQSIYYDLFGDISDLGFCTIDHGTGQITGLPHIIGDFSANVSAFDGVNTAWQNWTLHIYTNTPVFDSEPITEWQNGTLYQYMIVAHDPENEIISWGLEGNCTSFLAIFPLTGNVTNITGSITVMGWWYVNISAFDGFTIVWQNYTLTALNTAPSITSSPVLTGTPGVNYFYNLDATDINSDNLYYDIYETDASWAVIDHSNGEVSGVPVLPGNYYINASVFDGLTTTYSNWTVTVSLPGEEPETPPVDTDPSSSGPLAKFTYTIIGNKVIVEDTSIGEITRRQWSFGDGFGSQESKLVHAYLEPGYYTISLTIWKDGYSSTAEITVYIGEAQGWYFDKGEVGFVLGTPYGSLELNAVLCLMSGLVVLIISIASKKMPLVRPKYWRIAGIVLLVIGMMFYVV